MITVGLILPEKMRCLGLDSMETYIEFQIFPGKDNRRKLRASDLNEDAYSRLCSKWPDFATANSFKVRLPTDSEQLLSILRCIEELGKTANWEKYPKVGYHSDTHFQLKGIREFSFDEIEAAEYLQIIPSNEIAESGGHLENGFLYAKPNSVDKRVSVGRISGSIAPVCDDEIKRNLEREELVGLTFKSVHFDYKGKKRFPPIWQLWSRVILPELRNPLYVCEETPRACFQINDLYNPPIPTFAQESFPAERFDFALTKERLGGGQIKSRDPLMIVSKKARKFLEQRNIPASYIPIKVSEASKIS